MRVHARRAITKESVSVFARARAREREREGREGERDNLAFLPAHLPHHFLSKRPTTTTLIPSPAPPISASPPDETTRRKAPTHPPTAGVERGVLRVRKGGRHRQIGG